MLPVPIETSRLESLVKKVREGKATKEEKQEIIAGHLRLLYSVICKKFDIRGRNDLMQEGALAMVAALERARLYDDKITPYLINAGIRACYNWLSKSRTVSMKRSTLLMRLREGLNSEGKLSDQVPKVLAPEYLKEIAKLPIEYQNYTVEHARDLKIKDFKRHIRNVLYEICPIPAIIQALADIPREDSDISGAFYVPHTEDYVQIEIEECLKKATNNFIEQAIVNFRKEGMTYQEIAKEVGLGKSRIGEILNKIEERFYELYR